VSDPTNRLFVLFTSLRRASKRAAVKFDYEATRCRPTNEGPKAVSTPQDWISQSSNSFDVVAPIKARACDALRTVVRSKPRQLDSDPRLMCRGAERC
jgi:hypothetical protein